jgi:hypothetical protein
MTEQTSPLIRQFDTGATRDLDVNKLDYEGFLSPLALDAFATYMHGKRKMADGSLRDSDNWQKGIPLDAYMKSGYRHFLDWWKHHRGVGDLATEDEIDTLCALLFNVQGYLHELLKERRKPLRQWLGENPTVPEDPVQRFFAENPDILPTP